MPVRRTVERATNFSDPLLVARSEKHGSPVTLAGCDEVLVGVVDEYGASATRDAEDGLGGGEELLAILRHAEAARIHHSFDGDEIAQPLPQELGAQGLLVS